MKNTHTHLGLTSIKILRIGMPVIILYLVYILQYLKTENAINNIIKVCMAVSMLEHVIMALTLLIAGAFILDVCVKRDK